MQNLTEHKNNLKAKDEFAVPVQNTAQISTEETLKELVLQKEDTKMKQIIARVMLMKQIEKKKKENDKLQMALQKLAERRKMINSALKQQRQTADEKIRMVLVELERQKELIDQKEKGGNQRQKENFPKNKPKSLSIHDTEILKAHRQLVNKSNERILARLEDIKLENKIKAAKQETLQKEQSAFNILRTVQNQRKREQKVSVRMKPPKTESLGTKKAQEIRLSPPLSNFNENEKKQVLNWLDLERNAAILEKTDKAVAEKIKAKNVFLSLSGNNEKAPSAEKVMSAAQVVRNSGNTLKGNDFYDIKIITSVNNTDSDVS